VLELAPEVRHLRLDEVIHEKGLTLLAPSHMLSQACRPSLA
jgi:hypothetical protein